MKLAALALLGAAACRPQHVTAVRLSANPLINADAGTGDNVNGPSLIRVPAWVKNPLGRYYLYFAHHKGRYIRLAYADRIEGPWRIQAGGVLGVEATEFHRPQPDPEVAHASLYTHVASPEAWVDEKDRRIVLYVHGMWTNGRRWPSGAAESIGWMRDNGYAQHTQAAVSADGLHFDPRPGITKESYLRLFPLRGGYYAMGRLGVLLRSKDALGPFQTGPNPFAGGEYEGRVRHVALLPEGDVLNVFFSAIGDSPEHILHTAIKLGGDWREWRAAKAFSVLKPERAYECPDLPDAPSRAGEIHGRAKQMRDPAIFREGRKTYLLYTVCGEQGIAAAELTFR